MKGDIISESPAEIWAVLIFAGIVAATIILLRATYIDYSAFLQTPPEKLEAIEAANAIKSCFEDGKPYVTEDFLTTYDGDDVNDLCGFDKPNAEATIYDIENSRKWKFDSSVNKPVHAVWIPIAYQSFDEIRDMEYELKGEYVITAKWFGTGGIGIPANDVMLELYPSGLYLGDEGKIEKVDPNKIVGWVEKMPDNNKKTDIRRSDLSGLKINSIIPAGYALAKCEDLGGLTKHEYCVRLSRGVKEVHLGRIDVDVEVDTNANFRL